MSAPSLRQGFKLLGGPLDEKAPRNLCRYRAPTPGRLASLSIMTQILEDPSPDETLRLMESDVESLKQPLDIILGTLGLVPDATLLDSVHPLSRSPNDGAPPRYNSQKYLSSSACRSLSTDSHRATRGSSSVGISLSSYTMSEKISKGLYVRNFHRYVGRPCRDAFRKYDRLRPPLRKNLRAVCRREKAARGMRERIRHSLWRWAL